MGSCAFCWILVDSGGSKWIRCHRGCHCTNPVQSATSNQFFKSTLAENQMCLVSVGLQIKAAKFASVSPMKLTFEKPVIVMPGDVCVLLKPESNTVRIIGSGVPQ